MKTTPLLAFLAISAVAMGQQHSRISIIFTDTDAAFVLQAISKQTGESILYNNKNKAPITLNLNVNSVDEAIKAVSSAASLVMVKVGKLYLVAPRDAMKDMLVPYTHTSTFTLEPGFADQVTPTITAAFPNATVIAIGNRISFTGTKEDTDLANQMINDLVQIQRDKKASVSELINMHSMNADEVVPLIKGLYPGLEVSSTVSKPSAAVAVGPDQSPVRQVQSYGAIGLRGPENLVKLARETIEKLDTPAPVEGPNRIVTKVYHLKHMNGPSVQKFLKTATPEVDVFVGPEDFSPMRGQFAPLIEQIGQNQGGSTTQSSSGGAAQSTGTTSTATGGPGSGKNPGDRAKTVVIKGRQRDVDSAVDLIAELDVKPRQVKIDVKVIETSPTNSELLGIGYTFSPVNFYDVPPGTSLLNAAGAVTLTNGTTQSLAPSIFSRTPLNFVATLNAMVTNQTAKLLAQPSLNVVDNDQGYIFIGNTISVELNSAGALGAQNQSIVQFPVGIILLVSPRISPDGTVTMNVNPVISTVSSINAQGIPQTAAREAQTTMMVKDGDTVVMGGLIQDQDSRTISEVPFLSKIPLIGELFRNRTHTRTREDILVSITTHIVKDTP